MTDKEFDRWFTDNIVKPARLAWGPGWNRLSEDQQQTEIRAALWINLAGQQRLERALEDNAEAAAYGRHAARLMQAYHRFLKRLTSNPTPARPGGPEAS